MQESILTVNSSASTFSHQNINQRSFKEIKLHRVSQPFFVIMIWSILHQIKILKKEAFFKIYYLISLGVSNTFFKYQFNHFS